MEPPFLTECKNARSHVDRSSNSLSNSEARVASRFEDSIDDVVDILLGIPDELISRTPVFNGVRSERINTYYLIQILM